jgi:hypothetical protein
LAGGRDNLELYKRMIGCALIIGRLQTKRKGN